MVKKAMVSLCVVTALAGAPAVARADPPALHAVLARSRIVVHVLKKGLFSGMAHDHHFVPGDWNAKLSFDAAHPAETRVEVIIAAASLRDEQPDLSPEDRQKVNGQAAGGDVLDAAHHPEIRFSAQRLELRAPAGAAASGEVQGVFSGTLSLHGRAHAVSVPVRAVEERGGWRARGTATFKQSDFGIEPYSGFLGTVAVHDEVKVDYDLFLAGAR
jgi:polyisoprenoid-binding protein YceI